MKYKIYHIKDPLSLKIRYVGLTSDRTLLERLCKHIAVARSSYKKRGSKKDKWIINLVEKGLIPIIELIDETNHRHLASKLEIQFISQYRKWKYPIFNISEGGYGIRLYGENHHGTKISSKNVINIRKLYKTGKWTQRELAKMYNISRSGIVHILNINRRIYG